MQSPSNKHPEVQSKKTKQLILPLVIFSMIFGETLPPVLGLTCLKSHNASVQGTTHNHFFSSITSFFSVKHWARHPSLTHESTLGPANTPLAAPASSEDELLPQRTAPGTQRQPTWHLLGFPVFSIPHKRVFRSESAAHLPTGRREPRTHCTASPNQPFDKIFPPCTNDL